MQTRAIIGLLLAPLALSACYGEEWASNSSAPISDGNLKALIIKPYDKARMMGKRIVLGTQNGVKVIAEFPCGDLCPEYTARLIHLDLDPGSKCTAAGGVEEEEGFSIAGANTSAPFCVPPAIARH